MLLVWKAWAWLMEKPFGFCGTLEECDLTSCDFATRESSAHSRNVMHEINVIVRVLRNLAFSDG
jgi:hypothetical protein